MAEDYDVELLGALPLDIRIREQADSGKPTVVADPDGADRAQIYREIARKVARVKIAREGAGPHRGVPEDRHPEHLAARSPHTMTHHDHQVRQVDPPHGASSTA